MGTKLVFYSGGQTPSNRKIHEGLGKLARKSKKKGRLSLTYVPVWSDSSAVFFRRFIKRYRPVGFSQFTLLPVDAPVPNELVKRAFKSDVIYLAGGNTFYFLAHLKKSGLLPLLKKFAKRGGIIAGLSAGAIIMTPSIHLAAYPPFDADKNDVKLKRKNWNSLGLVNFEFFPHFEATPRLNKALARYSRRCKRRVYVCQDGGGIILEDKEISFFGKVKYFENGSKYDVSPRTRRQDG